MPYSGFHLVGPGLILVGLVLVGLILVDHDSQVFLHIQPRKKTEKIKKNQQPRIMVPGRSIMVSGMSTTVSSRSTMVSGRSTMVSGRSTVASETQPSECGRQHTLAYMLTQLLGSSVMEILKPGCPRIVESGETRLS